MLESGTYYTDRAFFYVKNSRSCYSACHNHPVVKISCNNSKFYSLKPPILVATLEIKV
jgi:hypothetical protein